MKMWKKQDGLTLVELMVSITIGSLIMLAASTVLLLGLRINHKTTEAVTQQYTARTVLTVLEKLASEGGISKIYGDPDGSWIIYGADQTKAVFSYSAAKKQILTGEYSSTAPILENIVASHVTWDEKTSVLTISLQDFEQTYSSSIYCRKILSSTGTKPDNNGQVIGTTDEQRVVFLETLRSQAGMRAGLINHDKGPCATAQKHICENYNFFSEWYIGGFDANSKAQGWSADTPWCACFVSWGLVQSGKTRSATDKWYANVDEFMKYFMSVGGAAWKEPNVQPDAGDLVFFNMIDGDRTNPSHMGVVVSVDDENAGLNKWYVYTIEGNSADMVAENRYLIDTTSIEDSPIIGYGNPWA